MAGGSWYWAMVSGAFGQGSAGDWISYGEGYSCEVCRPRGLGGLSGSIIQAAWGYNRFNFLVYAEKVVLIDYDTVRKCDDAASLREEPDALLKCLQDDSTKGGRILMRIHDKEAVAA